MSLEKLTIKPLPPSKLAEFKVLFNPNSYRISKTVNWSQENASSMLDAPSLDFGGGSGRELTLNLFFDVTEEKEGSRDVRSLTNRFVELTRIERSSDQLRPPVCRISWGDAPPSKSDFPFTGVVTSLSQEFTLFDNKGKPVRARLDVTFKEFPDQEKARRETDPEYTTRVVKRGDTLSSIAAEMYGDPARWRSIADANNLDDPRRLSVGLVLHIPTTD
jgi:nucleoid-associated protein YgaU